MTPSDEKEGWHCLAVKNYLHYYMEQLQKIRVVLTVSFF